MKRLAARGRELATDKANAAKDAVTARVSGKTADSGSARHPAGRPATGHLAAGRCSAGQPATGHLAAGRCSADRPGAVLAPPGAG